MSPFFRGLDPHAKKYVPEVLEVLEEHGLLVKGRTRDNVVWMPVRSETGRVLELLASPSRTSDKVIVAAAEI